MLSIIVSRTESTSFDILVVTLDIKIDKENIPLSTVVSGHEVLGEVTNTQMTNNFEESLHKCYNDSHHISSWEELQEDLQVVLPNNPQFTYVVESFKQMPCEKFSGASKYAFELQARINISTANQAKEWLYQMFLHSQCTYRHTREERANAKRCYIKHRCIVNKSIDSKTRAKTKEM